MEKIIAVVVTYNRLEKLKKCIDSLINQTVTLEKIIVVNNASTDGTTDYLNAYEDEKIVHVYLKSNTGGAGGFAKAIQKAVELGADWIWGMDDDAFPHVEALEKLVESKEKYKNQNICMWSNCNNDSQFKEDCKMVDKLMFVGFFISKTMVEKIGVPRGDFFIYYDDIEYSDRIRKNGYSIIKVKNSIIDHNDAASDMLFKMNIGNKELQIVSCPKQNWRVYYWVRNDILRYTPKNINWLYKILVHTPIKLVKVLISKPQNIPIFIRGYIDGICSRTGKIEIP